MDLSDWFQNTPTIPSATPPGQQLSLLEWLYEVITGQLYNAFIKSPGLAYFETYVYCAASLVLFYIAVTNGWWYVRYYAGYIKTSKDNVALTLLKDDLIQSAPYKRNHRGEINIKSLVKLHAIIFKHSQRQIMKRERDHYQPERIKHLQANDMGEYKKVVLQGAKEYEGIGQYVTRKVCGLVNLKEKAYYEAYDKSLQVPEMLYKIRDGDEKTRLQLRKKATLNESREELKKIYIEWNNLQHESRVNQLVIEDQTSTVIQSNESFRMSLLVEQSRVQDLIQMRYRISIYDLERVAQEMKISEDKDIKELKSQQSQKLEKLQGELDEKHALTEDEIKLLQEVIGHVGKISNAGQGGLQLNFEDYKRLVKIMIMFGEELNWLNGREQANRESRRSLLREGKKEEYWKCLKQQKAAQYAQFKKVSKGVLSKFSIEQRIFQQWQQTFASRDDHQDKLDEMTLWSKKQVQMQKATKTLTKQDALKGVARERQLMLNPTVDMVAVMYSNNQAETFEAQMKMELEQMHAWDVLHSEMDGVEAEDILKATHDLKLDKDEQYIKIADKHKEMVQELLNVKRKKS